MDFKKSGSLLHFLEVPAIFSAKELYIMEGKILFHNQIYADENFVTAFVPSDTACFASSPGSINRTDVWISLLDNVAFLLYVASFPASDAIRSKISLMKEFMMDT